MAEIENNLTEQQRNTLREISLRTGTPLDQLIREAVERFIVELQNSTRSASLKRAQGMWRDRQDLPDPQDLRREWDRFDLSPGE